MSLPTALELGETARFKLARALLIYENERQYGEANMTAVTIHPVKNGTILAGMPVSRDTVEDLAAALGRNLAAGWLPPNLVSLGFGQIAWFCPAARRRIWFKADGRFNGGAETQHKDTQRVTKLNGKFVHHPPLLFLATARNLAVFALAKNERPGPQATLYRAPYWNLWEGGRMCAGSRALPDQPTPAFIPKYESGFFDSAFSHTNIRKICSHPGGHTGLWEELAARKRAPDSKYWAKNLSRMKDNVTAVLASKKSKIDEDDDNEII